MGLKKNNPGCACCVDCPVLEDDFDRSDSTNLGSDWVEDTGDSEIISGELSMPNGAIVRTSSGTGESDPYMKVTVTCQDVRVGDKFRVLVNWNTTTDDYYYGELQCLAASGTDNMKLIVGDSTTGELDSETFSFGVGNDMALVVCRTLEGIYVGSESSFTLWDCVTDNSGRHAGLMNNSASNTVEFEDFQFLRGFDGSARCFECGCECDGHCLEDTLLMTISATGFCESCLDGEEIDLPKQTTPADPITWDGSKAGVYELFCSSTATARFQFKCEGNKKFRLVNVNSHPLGSNWQTDGSGNVYAEPSSIQCDPFQVVFPLNVDNAWGASKSPPCGGPCDCEWTATITNKP